MILVIGTGRSGTSTVAKILHEHGISMGFSFAVSGQHDSGCTYEDLECKHINKLFLQHNICYDAYIKKLCEYGQRREGNGEWGVKHPAICHVIGIYLQVFDPVVVRCTRDRDGVVESCMRCYGFSEKKAQQLYDVRTVMLDSALKRHEHLEIDFTNRLTEHEIWEKVSDYRNKEILIKEGMYII